MSESVSESEIQILSKSVPLSDAMVLSMSMSGLEVQILSESASDINFGHDLGHMSDVASMSDFFCRKLK